MGLFSRNESAPGPERRSGSRSSASSEAQTKELRGRARRRLIGALALVIAAVIIVPMLLDTGPAPDQNKTPLVIPANNPPAAESSAPPAALSDNATQTPLPTPDSSVPDSSPSVNSVPDGSAPDSDAANRPAGPAAGAPSQTPSSSESASPARADATPSARPKPRPDEKSSESKPESKPDHVKRTDDGSVALALLEGRQPRAASGKKEAQGNYILQIAAYSTDKDAQVRKDRLVAAGVTNTYIETAAPGGKATYRLRVGPFPTREAAQAAQARLRALGYDNGFISTK